MSKVTIRIACLAMLALLFVGALTASGSDAAPPVAKVEPKVDTLFDTVLIDNYFWLREKENPEVIAYLEAENAYTEAITGHTSEFQENLYNELVGRIKETDLSVPEYYGGYYYYTREEEGKQYKFYCRKMGSLEAEEEILIDMNVLAEGHEFLKLGTYELSDDHNLLAYALDTIGNERYTLYVKDLRTGELYPDKIDNTSGNTVWAADNMTLFYTLPDESWRTYQLYRHVLGTDIAEDVLVRQEDDEKFWLGIDRSKDKKFMFMSIGSQVTDEKWFLTADNPTGEFQIIHPRQQDMEYKVYHHKGMFYILHNDNAMNFTLARTAVDKPGKGNWEEVIPHDRAVKLNDLDIFADHIVIYKRSDGLQKIEVWDMISGEKHDIEFPEPVYAVYGEKNPEYNTNLLRFEYMSMVTPDAVYDYDMQTRERELKKQKEVLGGFDSDNYQSERIFATADDGAKVPISLVYRKGVSRNGESPLYLYGYGSYGYAMNPYFSSNRISLLDRGFIFAMAHIRGGGDMGRYWYEDGKYLNKKNTFTDFIACADHLVAENYTNREKLVIGGGSAGGLLIGAVVNMRPDLCEVAVADVPFVDVVNTMLDESIPLTVIEYEEWGNPNIEEYFWYMLSYSPYDNVAAVDYPHMYITAGLHDTRVQYWEPAKWTAKLRTMNTSDNLIVLKTIMEAGHGGKSGRYDYLRDIAHEYAFILDRFGMTE
jgi:oligopeptidase B